MSRTLLNALNPIVFILVTLLGYAIQSSLFISFPLNYLQPDILLLATLWVSLKRSFFEGGILTLIFAKFAEIHSAAPSGVFLFASVFIFLSVALSSRYFLLSTKQSWIWVTLGASCAWKLVVLGLLYWLDAGANQLFHTLVLIIPSAICEAIAGFWFYKFCAKIDFLTYKDPRASRSFEENLELDQEDF